MVLALLETKKLQGVVSEKAGKVIQIERVKAPVFGQKQANRFNNQMRLAKNQEANDKQCGWVFSSYFLFFNNSVG